MPRVIKRRVKTAQSRKALQPRRGVANSADRILIVRKLLRMTAAARNVTRKFNRCRIVVSNVADQARKACMLRTAMVESRKVLRLRRRFTPEFRCRRAVADRVAERRGRGYQNEYLQTAGGQPS